MFGERSHSNDWLGNKMVDEILSLKCRVRHMGGNMDITASELATTIQNRDPGTVTDTSVKLFYVLTWSVMNHYKRRGEQNRKHHYTIII